MNRMQRKLAGFNYLELVITFVILIALGAIAYPAYQNYKIRAYFNNVVQIAGALKQNVTDCFNDGKKLSSCNGGMHSIPANITKPKSIISSLTVKSGVITVVPLPHEKITANDNYVLTPVVNKSELVWTTSGGAVADGFAD